MISAAKIESGKWKEEDSDFSDPQPDSRISLVDVNAKKLEPHVSASAKTSKGEARASLVLSLVSVNVTFWVDMHIWKSF